MSEHEIRVCSTADLSPGTAKRIDVEGYRLCVVRIGDDWYVVDDRCSHQDYSLAEGEVWEDDCEIECPKHGSTFSLVSGEPQSLPATKPVPVYVVRATTDDVFVTVGGDA